MAYFNGHVAHSSCYSLLHLRSNRKALLSIEPAHNVCTSNIVQTFPVGLVRYAKLSNCILQQQTDANDDCIPKLAGASQQGKQVPHEVSAVPLTGALALRKGEVTCPMQPSGTE